MGLLVWRRVDKHAQTEGVFASKSLVRRAVQDEYRRKRVRFLDGNAATVRTVRLKHQPAEVEPESEVHPSGAVAGLRELLEDVRFVGPSSLVMSQLHSSFGFVASNSGAA